MPKGVLFRRVIPRTLDTLVQAAEQTESGLQAWVFEDRETRQEAESRLAARGIAARIRSAYKPLLHFFLEEVELSGLSAVEIATPNHGLAADQRFRVEAYPLAGLLGAIPLTFKAGRRPLHYGVELAYGERRVVREVFAPNRRRTNPFGEDVLAPCGWVGAEETGAAVETEFELAFAGIMEALRSQAWSPPPHFDVLRMTVRTGGIEQRLPYGDECISTREALHEDLYFSVLEFFQHLDGRPPGDRTLQPGQIVPDIRRGRGPTEVVVKVQSAAKTIHVREDAAQSLEEAGQPLAPWQIAREIEMLGGRRFDGSSRRGAPVLATSIKGREIGLVITAGQHANETSGVVGALRAANVLKERGLQFSLVPQENPDGYALHRELRLYNPHHMHHAARYTALGDDLEHREAAPFGERAVRLEAFRREDVRLHVNLHGYPAHEWTRPLTGYVPRGSLAWMVPQGFFLIVRHHEGLGEEAERFVKALAERIARTPGIREFNAAHLKTFEAHTGGLPLNIHCGIPYITGENARFVPRFTLVAEYPDETIYGDAFCLAHTVQRATVIEAANLLDEGWLPAPDRERR